MFCKLNLRGVMAIERYPNIFPHLQVRKQPCELYVPMTVHREQSEIRNKNFDMLNTSSEITK
jgi:hypothetical protein